MNKVEFARSAKAPFAKRYDNFIGGAWVAPKSGRYFENTSPITGRFGRTVRTSVRAPLVPARLEAVTVTLCSPTSEVTPEMLPETGSRLNPSGKPAAA